MKKAKIYYFTLTDDMWKEEKLALFSDAGDDVQCGDGEGCWGDERGS